MEYLNMNSARKFSHSHHSRPSWARDFDDDEKWVRYMLALAKDPAGQTPTPANAADEDDEGIEQMLRLAGDFAALRDKGQGGDLK